MAKHVELSKDIRLILKQFPCLTVLPETNKVKCSLSGHEMPCRLEVIQSYVKGKKFLKLQDRDERNFEKFKPHLTPSTKKHHEHQLFCNLTFTHVNKTKAHVERHVNGVKYKRALARYEDCQRKGVEYKPPRGRRKKQDPNLAKGDHSRGDDGDGIDDEGEISETDSFSDLYPAEDFKENDENEENAGDNEQAEDSDFDFETMETTQSKPAQPAKQTSMSTDVKGAAQKRKFEEGKKNKKKNKKKQKSV